ncbi:MAG: protein kinase [Myxococcales bacterium]|nr:protein kinase [Myxococcales bacterium]
MGFHRIGLEYYNLIRNQSQRARDASIGMVIADFLIVRELGRGGFGRVYLALQLPLMMKAALKLMNPVDDKLGATLIAKFESEARSLAQLNHPNIVRLLKYGSFESRPYMVMEFVDGACTLKDEISERILRGAVFEPAEVRVICEQLLNALESAHNRQIVHRDVKPENVMLQEVEGSPQFVRVLDFGLAKFLDKGDQTSLLIGTPAYMAPEQITRSNIGPWTDLYALGVIMFELITGRSPFTGASAAQMLAQKVDPQYDPMSRLADLRLPPATSAFLGRAIAREPAQRFRSGAEFRRAMALFFDDLAQHPGAQLNSGDLTGLVSSSELRQLTEARAALEHERNALEQERQRLQRERAEFERERRDSGPSTSGPRTSGTRVLPDPDNPSAPQETLYLDAPSESPRSVASAQPSERSRASTSNPPSGRRPSPSTAPYGDVSTRGPMRNGAADAPPRGPEASPRGTADGSGRRSAASPRGTSDASRYAISDAPLSSIAEIPASASRGRLVGLFLVGLLVGVGLLWYIWTRSGATTQPLPGERRESQRDSETPPPPKDASAPTVKRVKPVARKRTPPPDTKDVAPAVVSRRVVIAPVVNKTTGVEVVDRITVTIDGKAIGTTQGHKGVAVTFVQRAKPYLVELSGKAIKPIRRLIPFDRLPATRLEIKITFDL